MDNLTRLQYLQAMGIQTWQLKSTNSNLAVPSTSQVLEFPVATVNAPVPAEIIPVQPISAATSAQTNLVTENQTPELVSAAPEIILPLTTVTATVVETDSWPQLEAEVSNCQQCSLCQTRTQTVFGTGNQQADWMFIGEAPGEQEDLQGKPFVGTAGTLLTEMIRAMGLSREQVFIANILKCRPPNNRDPKVDEVRACRRFLNRQIALVKPKIIIAVGRIAAHNLLNRDDSLAKLRSIVHQHQNIPLIVIYHPAYLLRKLTEKRAAWQDLQFALKTYQDIKEK